MLLLEIEKKNETVENFLKLKFYLQGSSLRD